MKLYADSPNADISVAKSAELTNTLLKISEENIQVIIESGTYLGTGSTAIIADVFKTSPTLERFYTIEVNPQFYKTARKNLKKYPFVTCLNGFSLSLSDAIQFLEKDTVINNHAAYPDIYIDDTSDPEKFYKNEILGYLQRNRNKRNIIGRLFCKPKENLLTEAINQNIRKKLFIVLDSSGGIGFLEFSVMERLLKNNNYFLFLDDIHHIKHFRSKEFILNSRNFRILKIQELEGWLVCEHLPEIGN